MDYKQDLDLLSLNVNRYFFLTITPSWLCNLRCNFCFQNSFGNIPCLNEDILYNRLLPIYQKTKQLLILGGEITVIPGMKDYIKFLKSHFPQLEIWFVTNGLNFDEEWTDLAIKLGINLEYSLNATNGLTYGKGLRYGNGDKIWQKVYHNLIRLIKRQEEENLHIINAISMVITNDTIINIEDFVKLAIQLGVDVKFLYDCTGVENTPEIQNSLVKIIKLKHICRERLSIRIVNQPVLLNKQSLETYMYSEEFDKEAKQFWQSFKISNTVNRTKKGQAWFGQGSGTEKNIEKCCCMPWQGLVVLPTGQVLPCSRLPNYILGDLNYESVEEILNSENANNLRTLISNNDYKYCRSDCEFNRNPSSSISGISCIYTPKYMRLFEQGRYADALPLYEKHIEIDSEDENSIYHLAYCYHMVGRNSEALINYNKSLEKGFSEFWVLYNRGCLLHGMGEYDKAYADLQRAADLDPQHIGARQVLEQLKNSI